MTKFGTVTQVVEKHVSKGSTTLHPKGAGPSIPQIFGTSYTCTHSMRNISQILHGDQTRCEESFYIIDHEC